MKKNKYVLIAASIVFAFLITSCGANNEQIIDDMSEESTMSMDDSSNVAENYEGYSGFWSVDGKTQDEVIASEGATLSCEIIDSNMFSGSLYTQQDISERFANVDNMEGTIENGKLYCDFEDDGWGGQGTLYIQFLDNQIKIEVLDYQMAEDNMTGYGISGNYIFIRSEASSASDNENDEAYQSMSDEELLQRVNERSTYYLASAYHDEVVDYWESVREATDITNVTEPLYDTDKMYYSSDDFSNDPPVILHLAKNEIYARRGYIFKDEDLNNYFMGCVWYQPLYNSDEFDDAIFNEYEKQNLELLSALDVRTINADDKMDVETAWRYLKGAYFSTSELEDISVGDNGNFQVVVAKTEMPFSNGDIDRPCESLIFFDGEEDSYYIFGHYYVFYDNNEVFGTKTIDWYKVDYETGAVLQN